MTTPSPILGGWGVGRSSNAEDSQLVNLFLEMVESKAGRSPAYFQMAPGLDLLLAAGTGGIRGLLPMGGDLYVVSGQEVYQISTTLEASLIGSITTTTGPVSMIENGTQLAIFDGYAGWLTTADLTTGGGQPITGGTVGAGGTNYAVGDDITLAPVGGTADATAIVTITAVSAGVVTAFKVTQGGLFSATPTSFTQASTDGSGSGFKIASPTYGAASGLAQIALPFTGGPVSATYQDGYGLVNDSVTSLWYQSDLFDLSIWEPLNFANANSQPDNVVGLQTLNREIFVFKDQHTEAWVNAGLVGFTFQRMDGVYIEYGTNAPHSISLAGQSICLVAQNPQGGHDIRRIEGYAPKRISNHGLETRMASYPTVSDAVGYSYMQEGHLFYVVTFPSGDETWAIDLTESDLAGQPLWAQRASFSEGLFHRHWGSAYSTWPAQGAVYQPKGIVMEGLQKIATGAQLANTPTSFSSAIFSAWVFLPEPTDETPNPEGLWFGDQTDDSSPGTGGVQIGIFNDQNSGAGKQIVVNLYDSTNAPILSATYPYTSWTDWIWVGISVDTESQTIQAFVGNNELSPSAIAWHSTNAIANTPGQAWRLAPAEGPA